MAYYATPISGRSNSSSYAQQYSRTPGTMHEYKDVLFQNIDNHNNTSSLQSSMVESEISQSECYDNTTFEVYQPNSQQNCVAPENCNQVIYPTVRYQEIQVSDPLFDKQINGNYSNKFANLSNRKRERAPLNTRCPKRRRPFQSTEGPFMKLLGEDDPDALSQAMTASFIDPAGCKAKPPNYTMYNVSADIGLSPVPGCTIGKDLLPKQDGKSLIPEGYKVSDIHVKQTPDGYQISAPNNIKLTDEDVNNIICAASTEQMIYRPLKQVGSDIPTHMTSDGLSRDSSQSDLTAGASASGAGNKNELNQEHQVLLRDSGSHEIIQHHNNIFQLNGGSSYELCKQNLPQKSIRLHEIGHPIVVQTNVSSLDSSQRNFQKVADSREFSGEAYSNQLTEDGLHPIGNSGSYEIIEDTLSETNEKDGIVIHDKIVEFNFLQRDILNDETQKSHQSDTANQENVAICSEEIQIDNEQNRQQFIDSDNVPNVACVSVVSTSDENVNTAE